ncbi:MAG: prolipoprotein diacylglyceryl transferase family protein, partial [Thermodesulfobacteriota bacterium]
QIYESLLSLIIFIILLIWRKTVQRVPGELFALQLGLYSAGRFGIEAFRGDTIRGIWGSLSTSQWISIPMLGVAFILALHISKTRRNRPCREQ